MPKRIKRGGDQTNSGSDSDVALMIGGLFFLFIAAGLVYFLVMKDKKDSNESDESEESTAVKTCDEAVNIDGAFDCPEGSILKGDKRCGENCSAERCCDEKSCQPPASLTAGYLDGGVTWSKELKYSDFENDVVKADKIDTSKMSCDTENKYSGTPSIKYCGTNENWEFTGCNDDLPSCKMGKNTDDRGHPYTAGRSSVSNCEENIELSIFDSLGEQANNCDQHYQNNGYFCKLVDDGNNNCIQAKQCRP